MLKIDTYEKALDSIDFTPVENFKKFHPIMIKFHGKIIKMDSGKYIWNKKGDAKAALRHAIDSKFRDYNSKKWVSQIIEELIGSGAIEFVDAIQN